MPKPRLLIPITIQFSIRYVLRTGLIEHLRDFCQPVVVLGWREEELEHEFTKAGAEVHFLIEAKRGRDYLRTRDWMNLWYEKRLASPSSAIRERRWNLRNSRKERTRRKARKGLFHAVSTVPGMEEMFARKEESLFWRDTNAVEVAQQMEILKPDAVFSLTPHLPEEETLARACARRGAGAFHAPLSFDNITTRGWTGAKFARYLVWNRHNRAQLLRARPHVDPSRISIVGAPQFDFYWNKGFFHPESEWRKLLSLPLGRPVILFGGGFNFCAPHEPRFLEQLDDAIERKKIPEFPIILFRKHPVDPLERWLPVLKRSKHIVYDSPWREGVIAGRTNIRMEDIQKLASSLHHSHVHVNVASTMTVDGAICDRPQIGPSYDDTPEGKFRRTAEEPYHQEHFLPITRSGGVDIVRSREGLIAAVSDALRNPERFSAGRKKIVHEICTFDDGKATQRVSRELACALG